MSDKVYKDAVKRSLNKSLSSFIPFNAIKHLHIYLHIETKQFEHSEKDYSANVISMIQARRSVSKRKGVNENVPSMHMQIPS